MKKSKEAYYDKYFERNGNMESNQIPSFCYKCTLL